MAAMEMISLEQLQTAHKGPFKCLLSHCKRQTQSICMAQGIHHVMLAGVVRLKLKLRLKLTLPWSCGSSRLVPMLSLLHDPGSCGAASLCLLCRDVLLGLRQAA